MRIGSSLILKAGNVVQSYGWKLLRPFGSLNSIIKHLDEFQCDEIVILRYVRKLDTMDNFVNDLKKIAKIESSSPISLGGGIRNKKQIEMLNSLPIERIVFSSAFLSKDQDILQETILRFGRQALQGLLPIYTDQNAIYIYNLTTSKKITLNKFDFDFLEKYANEVIIYDMENEGKINHFNFDILNHIPIKRSKLIITGGIGPICIKKAGQLNLASVLVDNKILHNEYSIENLKRMI